MLTTWTGGIDTTTEWIGTTWPEKTARGLFSLRHGGVSKKHYASLNVGLAVGDNPADVIENRTRIAQELGSSLSHWVVAQQVHGNQVHVVTEADWGKGAIDLDTAIPSTDGLITNCRATTLVVLAADCVPVLFFDSVRKVIGAAHSGWKGTVARISSTMIAQMNQVFGTLPQDVHVWLGPSIRRCCYEVDNRVATEIKNTFGSRFLVPRHRFKEKYLLGLQDCIRHDLVNAGVPSNQIQDTGLCTSCRVTHLYSHRLENGKTGRALGAIYLP